MILSCKLAMICSCPGNGYQGSTHIKVKVKVVSIQRLDVLAMGSKLEADMGKETTFQYEIPQ